MFSSLQGELPWSPPADPDDGATNSAWCKHWDPLTEDTVVVSSRKTWKSSQETLVCWNKIHRRIINNKWQSFSVNCNLTLEDYRRLCLAYVSLQYVDENLKAWLTDSMSVLYKWQMAVLPWWCYLLFKGNVSVPLIFGYVNTSWGNCTIDAVSVLLTVTVLVLLF